MSGAARRDEPPAFVEPTGKYWQTILPADHPAGTAAPPYRFAFPARLPDGRVLRLPIRPVPDGSRAAASLIANHASFSVVDTLTAFMAGVAAEVEADVVVGLPTLGLTFAPGLARALGHEHFVPLGISRKFWYRDALSEPVSSFTTPGAGKTIFLDPNLLPRIKGRRAILVDDAISSGRTILSALALLGRLSCDVSAIVVAMVQGSAWRDALAARDPHLPCAVRGVFGAPLFLPSAQGWVPIAEGDGTNADR